MSDIYVYDKDVSGDKNLESALRQSVNDWANGIPHHPYKNLGDKITVKSIWYKPAYPVRLRSQYEERSKHKDHEPFTGQTIPPRKYHKLSDFDSWDIYHEEISNFENSTTNYYVEGSQYVADCHHCDARGWMTCNTCHGNETITCPVCRGSREVHCNSCGGHGKKTCRNCNGTGKTTELVPVTRQVRRGHVLADESRNEVVTVTCKNCHGSGRIRCNTCRGTGKVTCDRCDGRGHITCPTCKGSGRITCPLCKGETQLMHYFYIKRELAYTDKQPCIIHGNISESFPEFMEEYSNYESKIVYSKKADIINKGQLAKGNHLNTYINQLLKEAKDDETSLIRMQFQQLDVYCIDTWELRYQLNGKEYIMAFTGSEYTVIPGLSPIYEVAFSYWQKGISAARFFLYSRAAHFLKKSIRIDVFEIKEKVWDAYSSVKGKLNQSYGLGAVIAFLLVAFFGGFAAYTYFSEVNYVFEYVSFINNPENFLYPYHAWSQTIFSVFLIYLAFKSSKSLVKKLGHYIPSAILRVATGILFTLVFSAIFLVAGALLNATGITIIITFIVWLALKILWILWWVIKIILGLIILAAEVVWGILKWLWGLFF